MANYETLKRHYEKRLKEFGPNARGMDWPNEEDLSKRFQVLSSIVSTDEPVSLLDMGCGVGLLIDYLQHQGRISNIRYRGIDISEDMIEVAKSRHPDMDFVAQDVLKDPLTTGSVDYIVMNGVLTEKQDMTQQEMVSFAEALLEHLFGVCKKGLSFNVMSSHVDWTREDLFHWPLDEIVGFLVRSCSRHIRIYMDYGLYEYTVHVKKEPDI